MTLDTFDLETEEGCNNEDTCICANELFHKLITIWGGNPPHPHDMTATNCTLQCDKEKTISILMNSLKLHTRSAFIILE